ncbi:hypothetical protein AB0425_25595 [Actinosynnema sp. NPDC051121]
MSSINDNNDGQLPSRPRRPGWTTARLEKTVTAAILTIFFAAPPGIALGAWVIFQPATHPTVGPVSAYIAVGLLMCGGAGWYAGYRQRVADHGRQAFASWPTYVLAAFAAGAFAVWSAHLSASVHTPEASPAAVQPAPAAARTAPPDTCAGGSTQACSNVLLSIQTTTDAFASHLKTACQAITAAAGDGQTGSWSPPADLVQDCTFWLNGAGQVRGVDDQQAEAHRLFNELATYAGWPPPNR